MNKSTYLIALTFILLSFGCNFKGHNLSLSTSDTNKEFRYKADYPAEKTGKLEKYLGHELNNDLPLDQNVDLSVNYNGSEKFNLKATKGHLEILFNKKGSSLRSYLKIKALTEGISNKLSEN